MTSMRLVLAVAGLLAAIHAASIRAADGTYQRIENWAQLPAGTTWGVMSWVDVDASGNVYAFQRAEPSAKVMVFDAAGRYLRSWGETQFEYPHSLRVLRDGNVWLTDRKLQQVFKYDPAGKLLLTIGQRGVTGDNNSRDLFNGVSDIVMAADGTLFVSDGEGGNTRIVKLSKNGVFIKSWGSKGTAPGQLNGPHCVTLDSHGRVYVCDRSNKRIQVFDQNGTYLAQFTQFGTPASIVIGKDNVMYVAAGEPDNKVTIGTTGGTVVDTIEGLNSPHGMAVAPDGAIYVAQSAGKAVVKFVKR